jgi:hypothetical protein
MILYVVCTAGEFVWNEGGVVPATCYLRLISRCVIFLVEENKSCKGMDRYYTKFAIKL